MSIYVLKKYIRFHKCFFDLSLELKDDPKVVLRFKYLFRFTLSASEIFKGYGRFQNNHDIIIY